MNSDNETNSKLQVVVIGAGPGGLTLARCAQLAGFNVAVYEKEASLLSRAQGGTLDLHPNTGQWAVKQANLMDEFRRLSRPESQSWRVFGKHGDVILDHSFYDYGLFIAPEIDRSVLRTMLMDSLPKGTIHWGLNLARVERKKVDADSRASIVLHFDNGQERVLSARNSVLVGADGAWSRVRPLLTTAEPIYTGVTYVEICITDVAERHPDIAERARNGIMATFADGKAVFAQMNGDGRLVIYLEFWEPDNEAGIMAGLGSNDGAGGEATANAKRAFLLSKFDGWAEWILDLIRKCDDDLFVERAITAFPIDIHWESQPGVTLIGDAAHQMSPFSGAGANLAMKDGAYFVKELVKAKERAAGSTENPRTANTWIETAIRTHEKEMMKRARREIRLSNFVLNHVVATRNGERNVRRAAPVMKAIFVIGGVAIRIGNAVGRLF